MKKQELIQDIEIALKILYEIRLTAEEMIHYNKVYPWSNEAISTYYNYYDLANKSALCVTGSGDHLIYAAAAGAKEIDAFDKNRLCKYYSALKIALMKTYDEKTFFSHFPYKRDCILSKKIDLTSIKDFLDEDFFTFWNEIINTKAFKKNKYLFRADVGECHKFDINYNLIKQSLFQTKIHYYDMNDNEFAKYTAKKYDAIFLSNMLEWIESMRRYITFHNYKNLLNDNGVLYDYYIKRDRKSISPRFEDYEAKFDNCVLVYRKK